MKTACCVLLLFVKSIYDNLDSPSLIRHFLVLIAVSSFTVDISTESSIAIIGVSLVYGAVLLYNVIGTSLIKSLCRISFKTLLCSTPALVRSSSEYESSCLTQKCRCPVVDNNDIIIYRLSCLILSAPKLCQRRQYNKRFYFLVFAYRLKDISKMENSVFWSSFNT